MNLSSDILKRKLATALLVTASVAAFATLGDGNKKGVYHKNMLTARTFSYNFKTFSLKSGCNYRGNTVFRTPKNEEFIMLNTDITYQKGNATYILPLKKKVLLNNKIKISLSPSQY